MAPKDANDLLIAGRLRDITTAVYEARSWRPGGIVNATELRERFLTSKPKGYSSPWKGLDALTLGMHQRRLYMFTAGTGAGKSTVVAGIAYDLLMRHGLTVGYVALEEGVEIGGFRDGPRRKSSSPLRTTPEPSGRSRGPIAYSPCSPRGWP